MFLKLKNFEGLNEVKVQHGISHNEICAFALRNLQNQILKKNRLTNVLCAVKQKSTCLEFGLKNLPKII